MVMAVMVLEAAAQLVGWLMYDEAVCEWIGLIISKSAFGAQFCSVGLSDCVRRSLYLPGLFMSSCIFPPICRSTLLLAMPPTLSETDLCVCV